MMESMPSDIRRFILAMPSIPYLEAILMLRDKPERAWDANAIAKYLYVTEDTARRVIMHLCSIGICAPVAACSDRYIYQPESACLDELIGRVTAFYSRNLVQVTNIIHANSDSGQSQKIQQFADAFKLRKEE